MYKFAKNSSSRSLNDSIHPLADGLLKCQQSNPVGYVTFRRHVIKEVVCKLFIDKNYTVLHTSIGQLLWFCEDLVQRTYCVETVKEEVLLLLPSMLTAAVLAENKAIVSDIIELLDEMCQKFDDRHLVVLCDAYQKVSMSKFLK